MSTKYRTTGKMGLFDTEKQKAKLSSIGNPLQDQLNKAGLDEKLEQVYEKFKVEPQICERAYRNRPLSDEQKAGNRVKSKTRSRVEHIFGFVTNSMHDFFSRCIGFSENKGCNFAYQSVLQYVTLRTDYPPATEPVPVKS
jgi:hypothetical protein